MSEASGIIVPPRYGDEEELTDTPEATEEEVRHIEVGDEGTGTDERDDGLEDHGYDLGETGQAETPEPNCLYAFIVIVNAEGRPTGYNLATVERGATGDGNEVPWPVPLYPDAHLGNMRPALLEVADDVEAMRIIEQTAHAAAQLVIANLVQMGAQAQRQAQDQAILSKVQNPFPNGPRGRRR